jgi:tetratricopeptide (TPR) repeat protein/TolB-like protein
VTTDVREQLQISLGDAYAIERELGGGGMSRTYVATERALSRRVVVKVLAPDLVAGVSVERFKREVLLAAQLQHPHVVPVLSSGDAQGLPWFTMPFVEGESLRGRLARGPLPIAEIVGVLRDVARALAFAHSRGVVHRDIKPDNVLLSEGSATVTDFGIAKAISASRTAAPGATLTMAGMSIGTPAYMAPEQAAGDPVLDHRSDLYAFGCMAYEMLAGKPPFQASSPAKLLGAHLGETPRDVRQVRVDVPEALAELVMRCLAKAPDARPQQASDLVRVLESVTSSGAATAAPSILAGHIRVGRALAIWAAGTALVAITAWAATVVIGLPDWVFPGSLGVMFAGLPVIAFTAWVQRAAHRHFTATPTFTPGGTPSSQGTFVTLALRASPHVSWRRTWLGGAVAVGAFVVLVVGFMVMRAFGIGPAATLMGKGAFGAREKLVVADFRSPASDSTLGATVAEAIRTDLTQSANLSVLTRATVREILRLMQRPASTSLEYETAREIATREGAKALLDGSVERLGPGYIVSARLVSALDGGELATFRTTAGNEGELIAALGDLTKSVREKVGESLKTIRETKALERVTTSSLPALRRYVDGMFAIEALGEVERGRTLLEEAVRLDTTFAMAWRRIAASFAGAGRDRERQMQAIAQAYRYRDRLSDNERLVTEAGYYSYGPDPDIDRTIASYEALLERDSANSPALNNGGLRYSMKRDFARAEVLLRRAVAVPSPFGGSFTNLARAQLEQGKLAAAESTAAQFEHLLPSHGSHWLLRASIAIARGDVMAAERLARDAYADPKRAAQRELAALITSQASLLGGRVREGLRWIGESNDVAAKQAGTRMPVLRAALDSALATAFYLQDSAKARDLARRGLAHVPMESLPPSERLWASLVRIATASGDLTGARTALQSFERDLPAMAIPQGDGQLAELRAEVAMAGGKPHEAIEAFREADRAYFSSQRGALVNMGRAFDLAGQRDSALRYFELYVQTPKSLMTEDQFFLAGSYKRLGELYEAEGELSKAVASYERFVTLWKDADAELQPRVRDARARIERLRAEIAKRG